MRRLVMAITGALALALAGASVSRASADEAVFAGGCFWSVEKTFDGVRGVTETMSGFSGGTVADPSYREVVAGGTGHLEAVKVTYDPSIVSYGQLLDAFWHSIDPVDPSGQFCDKGPQYHTAIFVGDPTQRAEAEASKADVGRELGKPVSTDIRPAAPFYAAEAEHQNFHIAHAAQYERYRIGCGRDAALAKVWGARAFTGAS